MTALNALTPELPADAFSLTPDPARVFQSRHHTEALAALKRGLDERRRLLVAVAEVGMGKTTLAYALLTSLPKDVRTAYIANPRLPLEGLVRHALADFGVRCEGRDRPALLGALDTFLADCAARGDLAVFAIDEAQSLDDGAFEELHLLLDLGTDPRGRLQLILFGQPELDAKLREPRLRHIAAGIAGRVHLKPLDPAESRQYIAHRLEQSGSGLQMFDEPALDVVLRHAQGVPRRMNILCHNAMLLAYAAGASRVTRPMAEEAIQELSGATLVRLRGHPGSEAVTRARRWEVVRTCSAVAAMVAAGAFVAVRWRQPAAPPAAERTVERQVRPARPVPVDVAHEPGPRRVEPERVAPPATRPTTIVARAEPESTPPATTPLPALPAPAPTALERAPNAAAPTPAPTTPVVPTTAKPAPRVEPAPPTEVARATPAPAAEPAPAAQRPPVGQGASPRPGETSPAPPAPLARATPPAAVEAPKPPAAPAAQVARPTPPPVQVARTTPPPAAAPPPPPAAQIARPTPRPPSTQVARTTPPPPAERPTRATPPPAPVAIAKPPPATEKSPAPPAPPPAQLARTTPSPAVEPWSEPPPPPHPAPASGVSDADVRALLDRYARAWHAQDLTELRRIGQIVDERQAEALAKYFEGIRDLVVEVQVLEMIDGGDRRTVRFTRRDRFRDPGGHEVFKQSPPIEKTIMRTPDGLKFAPRS